MTFNIHFSYLSLPKWLNVFINDEIIYKVRFPDREVVIRISIIIEIVSSQVFSRVNRKCIFSRIFHCYEDDLSNRPNETLGSSVFLRLMSKDFFLKALMVSTHQVNLKGLKECESVSESISYGQRNLHYEGHNPCLII